MKDRDYLNKLFAPLAHKYRIILSRLTAGAFPATAAWYNGH